ncbi:hypothetical protein [Pseudosulfitobacter pseudonitzschiae]|uniref:hypothetical protein n=1 Tax=Pseudosulfitobacter pseudonitzschiae TaxID=1402135 RepID=UPI001AF06C7D|nr:hypothetical protein [Pseudosulfitobacter pseudonitzschiae]MBM1816133.1 hypothetical protein [Pseudosulfitobacter pseudonitzschiae]MBM1833439.1 hypothetical protein [Pseudosulfitobacter pseudonitzschiae]MBM1838306.1 hypothetical protein [Pseudosulfitobacter pseudonitzschiae]MBM1842838.1 hypothetical protein [Pseudosulfitobacter pseudonitzschiae]MBM1847704.1 hypothetical protein [Pseudosulfitobacter pseudonitzschiae]
MLPEQHLLMSGGGLEEPEKGEACARPDHTHFLRLYFSQENKGLGVCNFRAKNQKLAWETGSMRKKKFENRTFAVGMSNSA